MEMKKSTYLLIREIILTLITLYVAFVMNLPETIIALSKLTPTIKFTELGIRLFFAVIWLVTLPFWLSRYLRAFNEERFVDDLYVELKNKSESRKSKKKINSEAERILVLLMNMKNTEQRVSALKKMTNPPNQEILRVVKNKAIEKQDFESCEALKIYTEGKNLGL